jgi:hypothetical protein
MDDSHHFKKLMWWGADILTNQIFSGVANPLVNSTRIRWNDLRIYRWNDLTDKRWYAPLVADATVTTSVTVSSVANRKFAKFKKALRFRQINFQIFLTGDGSPATGPARFFSITALVSAKQVVSKQVS